MAVDLASRERARDYGTTRCRVCGDTFQRGSGASTTCQAERCQRQGRQAAQQRHEQRRRARRRLQAHEEAFRDTAAQLAFDLPRRLSFEAAARRWEAVLDCRTHLSDPDAATAYRQALLDVGAAVVLIASALPQPSIALRLEPDAKRRVGNLMAALDDVVA